MHGSTAQSPSLKQQIDLLILAHAPVMLLVLLLLLPAQRRLRSFLYLLLGGTMLAQLHGFRHFSCDAWLSIMRHRAFGGACGRALGLALENGLRFLLKIILYQYPRPP